MRGTSKRRNELTAQVNQLYSCRGICSVIPLYISSNSIASMRISHRPIKHKCILGERIFFDGNFKEISAAELPWGSLSHSNKRYGFVETSCRRVTVAQTNTVSSLKEVQFKNSQLSPYEFKGNNNKCYSIINMNLFSGAICLRLFNGILIYYFVVYQVCLARPMIWRKNYKCELWYDED